MTDSIFIGNHAQRNGGGFFCSVYSDISLNNISWWFNYAGGNGGSLYMEAGASVVTKGSIFNVNYAFEVILMFVIDQNGGAIYGVGNSLIDSYASYYDGNYAESVLSCC